MVISFLFSSFQSGERRRTRGSTIFHSFFDTLPQAVRERVRQTCFGPLINVLTARKAKNRNNPLLFSLMESRSDTTHTFQFSFGEFTPSMVDVAAIFSLPTSNLPVPFSRSCYPAF